MKKWGFFVMVILLLVVGFRYFGPNSEQESKLMDDKRVVLEETETNSGSNTESNTESNTKSDTNKNSDASTVFIDISEDQVYQGDLLLVNKKHPVREESVKSDIVNLFEQKDLIQGYGLLDTNIRLSKSVAQTFLKMIEDAKGDKVNSFLISSGYRDFEEQQVLYQQKGSDYALPAGYSEHNLGLSLDIGSTEAEMSTASEGKWLKENAWKYGFILRYPEDKTEITGIQYEPWHFRYVGMPHSAIMQERGFTLEEYIDFLRDNQNLVTEIDEKYYEVTYHPVSEDTAIELPADRKYEISGNNIDGVIITME